MNIGIDKIGFYTPPYYIDMIDLAHARDVDPNKFTVGLGQSLQSVCPITQDTVTLAANAAHTILTEEDRQSIDLVIVATESSIDQSKAAATSVHALLHLPKRARCIEMKQACYSATAAIQLAKGHIALNPNKKALVIASDISKYGLASSGEPTQGVGAVAILISNNPSLCIINDDAEFISDDIWDFWRPNYTDLAYVDGKYSNEAYQRLFLDVFKSYCDVNKKSITSFDALCFHIPYTKMGLKSLRLVADENDHAQLFKNFEWSTTYNRQIGNIYTGSLYLSLIGLLDHGSLKPGDTIGLYSYGSGAVGEFFTLTLCPNFSDFCQRGHQNMLSSRKCLSIAEYESMFNETLPTDGSESVFQRDSSPFSLKSIHNHRRTYYEPA